MKLKILFFVITSMLFNSVNFSIAAEKPVSRYETNVNKKELECFFNNFSNYLSSPDDKRLLGLQRSAIKDLVNTNRDDGQYVITVQGQINDLDLTFFYNKANTNLTKIYIAGRTGILEALLNEINGNCNLPIWTKKESKTRKHHD